MRKREKARHPKVPSLSNDARGVPRTPLQGRRSRNRSSVIDSRLGSRMRARTRLPTLFEIYDITIGRRIRRPFRGAGPPAATRAPSRALASDFHEHRAGVRRIHDRSIDASSVRVSPFAPGVAVRHHRVFSSGRPGSRVNETRTPAIALLCSSKHSKPASRVHRRDRHTHLSWGSMVPFSATNGGRPFHPEIPTSGTFRPQGFSPSRRLASPFARTGLFHPVLRSWGSSAGSPPRPVFRPSTDANRSLSRTALPPPFRATELPPDVSSRAFSPPATAECLSALPLLPCTSALQPGASESSPREDRDVLARLATRETPALLEFPAAARAHSHEARTSLGCPSDLLPASPPYQILCETIRSSHDDALLAKSGAAA